MLTMCTQSCGLWLRSLCWQRTVNMACVAFLVTRTSLCCHVALTQAESVREPLVERYVPNGLLGKETQAPLAVLSTDERVREHACLWAALRSTLQRSGFRITCYTPPIHPGPCTMVFVVSCDRAYQQ